MIETQFRKDDLPKHRTLYRYDEAGRHVKTVEMNPDGSQRDSEVCHHKGEGRKSMVRFLDPKMTGASCMYGVEGSEIAYPANGATTMTTMYDESDRPVEVQFRDASDQLLQRIIMTRDNAGRVASEEMRMNGPTAFPGLAEKLESAPFKDRARIGALVGELMGSRDGFSKTTYAYDEKGRILERCTSMLSLGGERTTFRYDEHGNPIETTTEQDSLERSFGEYGEMRTVDRDSHTQQFRFQYQYDAQGNWTERVVLDRLEANGEFQPSHIEHREITYWDP